MLEPHPDNSLSADSDVHSCEFLGGTSSGVNVLHSNLRNSGLTCEGLTQEMHTYDFSCEFVVQLVFVDVRMRTNDRVDSLQWVYEMSQVGGLGVTIL